MIRDKFAALRVLFVLAASGSVSGCAFSGTPSPNLKADFNSGIRPKEGACIVAGEASTNKGSCEPTWGGRSGKRRLLKVDTGPITVNSICNARILPDFFGRRTRMSSFEFVAEAGHVYTITAMEKECMSLFDITFEETLIACEPYGKVE